MDIDKIENYDVYPLINGFSDHDAQIITLKVTKNMPYEHQLHF